MFQQQKKIREISIYFFLNINGTERELSVESQHANIPFEIISKFGN